MKTNKHLLLFLMFLFTGILSAQEMIIVDDLEWPIYDCPSYWVEIGIPPYECPFITDGPGVGPYSGNQCILIPDDQATDDLLALGNKIFGIWKQNFWMYVPSTQEAYWNLQGNLPVGGGEWIMGNFFFNKDLLTPGVGIIDDCPGAPVNFMFPHNEWFEVYWEFDMSSGISNASCYLRINGNDVLPPGTPFTNASGQVPTGLGGIDFFSVSAYNYYYLDAFGLESLSVVDHGATLDFHLLPNPVSEKLQLLSNQIPEEIRVLNYLGQQMDVYQDTKEIQVSHLASGLYFAEVTIDGIKGIQRFIKN